MRPEKTGKADAHEHGGAGGRAPLPDEGIPAELTFGLVAALAVLLAIMVLL